MISYHGKTLLHWPWYQWYLNQNNTLLQERGEPLLCLHVPRRTPRLTVKFQSFTFQHSSIPAPNNMLLRNFCAVLLYLYGLWGQLLTRVIARFTRLKCLWSQTLDVRVWGIDAYWNVVVAESPRCLTKLDAVELFSQTQRNNYVLIQASNCDANDSWHIQMDL